MTAATEPTGDGQVFLRIEKGRPDAMELAALTAALFQRLAAQPAEPDRPRPRAGWRRPERSPGFQGPRSWQDTAP
ncbi:MULTISPECIES: acyl-CoA carboxylase subunit epsilon [Streptomyces violaceusniger group]|uniref:Acyl-CoA carboxylase epsilon subunit n=2 Tax=Streptomyces rhizosphaericus TaxID=114699 RepID=A0ABN1SLY0_9ACTN|nr:MULTISPECIES: acyl-CoA carboxylase subunit epsilon [Streptomyces violaceusniger group]